MLLGLCGRLTGVGISSESLGADHRCQSSGEFCSVKYLECLKIVGRMGEFVGGDV